MSADSPDPPAGELNRLVAENVRALMARRGRSQVDVAPAVGLTQTTLSRRLRALTPFDVDDLELLARAFDVDPCALLQRPD